MKRHHGAGFTGFTLLELVVAVALLAVVSTLGYTSLRYLQASAAGAEQHLLAMRQLQVAVALFERDLRNVAPRPVSVGLAARNPALMGAASSVELTRGGVTRATGDTGSALMRVGYRFADGALHRRVWRVLDQPSNDAGHGERLLLDGLVSATFRYADGNGGWRAEWQGPPDTPLPRAVEMNLRTVRSGNIRRLVVLN